MKTRTFQFLILALFLSLSQTVSFAQELSSKRIKILILGTFHFGETKDVNKTEFPDLQTEKRQKEVAEVVELLSGFKPDKVFIENEPTRQDYWNQVLSDYKKGTLKEESRNEIFQIGIRLAGKLNQNQVYCIDDQTNPLDYGKIRKFEEEHKNDNPADLNADFFNLAYPVKRQSPAPKLANVSLREYLLFMNSPAENLRRSYDYTHYALGEGRDADYTGTDFTATWYKRNLYIFTNILRKTDKKDDAYLLLIGAGHSYSLQHFFESNPHFEVINVADVLNAKTTAAQSKMD